MDPGKRSQLGAHYTSKEDILLIVEPVVIEPLQARWQAVKAEALALAAAAEKLPKGAAYNKLRVQMQDKLYGWLKELSAVRILDPACGSGNFLYLALRRMLDLWREVYLLSAAHGLPTLLPHQVHPSQLYGLETNVYAHELASVVVWIGYLQWLNDNGIGWPTEPILRKLDNIQNRDAILAHSADGTPVDALWPEADFIIGNPPFLGGNYIRQALGNKYTDELFSLYKGRIPATSDLVCYWFERGREMLESHAVLRIGLLATQGIRGGANREVLSKIKVTGDIFMAWSDRDWLLDGATVHVSIVGFDDGTQTQRMLDGQSVSVIHADLTSASDLVAAKALIENKRIAFRGFEKNGAFEISPTVAHEMNSAPLNPNGRPNSDVIKSWVNAMDIASRPRGLFIIDFGTDMSESEAALYERPFEYVRVAVKPIRDKNNREHRRSNWWLHGETNPGLRSAIGSLKRFIVTPRHSKYRLFTWVASDVLADSALIVFTRDDDYFLGVLHSHPHELWSRRTGTQVRDAESGFRYTPLVCFDPFPFPWPPGHEPKDSPLVEAIAEATRDLVAKRDAWLNPPNASADELKRRTLTNLYNARSSWLAEAHRKLDAAVFAAYGWPVTLSDAELLEHLLALNHQRAAR